MPTPASSANCWKARAAAACLRGNVLLLTDEKATTAAVRNGFQDFLKRRAGKNDTVVILIAGHGTVEVPGSKGAFILTYDSDPQDLKSTALPMAELQSLFEEQLTKVGRVLLFVDVCKAGTIGTIHNTTVNSNVQQLGDIEGDLFGLLASRPKEVSLEGPQFGGGHGVFSYFVIKGLEGAADDNKDGIVDANELIKYVSDQVPMATANKQHPREFGTYDNTMQLSDVKKPGIDLAHWRVLLDSRNGEPLYLAAAGAPGQLPSAQPPARRRSIHRGASTPAAFCRPTRTTPSRALADLKPAVAPEQYQERENQLRIALENKAQQVLLRYLAGDETPQSRKEFEQGARYMEAARTLTQESLFLEGRQDFFQGRALLFDKKFPEAAQLLEQSVRIDPGGAYGYNALGIAYLEQAAIRQGDPRLSRRGLAARSIGPIRCTTRRWLTSRRATIDAAIRAYQEAIRLTPQYSYLALQPRPRLSALESPQGCRGGVSQSRHARAQFGGAIQCAGHAESVRRQAPAKPSSSIAKRCRRIAKLLAGASQSGAAAGNRKRTASRKRSICGARICGNRPITCLRASAWPATLADRGDNAAAIEEYRKVLAAKPDYVAARSRAGRPVGEDRSARSGHRATAPGLHARFRRIRRSLSRLAIWKRQSGI